jgi:hypothetical protein
MAPVAAAIAPPAIRVIRTPMIAAAAPPAIVPKGLSAKENSQSTRECDRHP